MKFDSVGIHRFVLSNGVRVICIPVPGRRSITFGVWVLSGSALEPPSLMGVSHFLEHIVFKGTRSFTARQIVQEIERRGGSIDAYTAKEETCFHSLVLSDDAEIAIRILSELVCQPLLREEDVELERQVILSEISEVWDDTSSLAQDIFPVVLFGDCPIGRPILGSPETVSTIKPDEIRSFWRENYNPRRIIVGAAGNVDPEKLPVQLEGYLSPPEGEAKSGSLELNPLYDGKLVLLPRKTQQVHFLLGVRTFPYRDERRYPLALLDVILGRGSSSRLFQIIREKMGIAYVIQSFSEFYVQTGFWALYAGTAPENFPKLVREVLREIERIVQEPVSDEELEGAKNFLKGRLLLSSESPWHLLTRAIEGEVHLGRFVPFEETVERLMEITPEDIRALARDIFSTEKIVAMAMGEVDEKVVPTIPMEVVREGEDAPLWRCFKG